MRSTTLRARGFTLVELLVVIAILATVAGGILVAYDGLETDAAQGQAAFNIAATDRAVRTFRLVNKTFPNNLDSLVVASAAEFSRMLPAKLQGVDGNAATDAIAGDDGKLAFFTLDAATANALTSVGITSLRSITDSASNVDLQIPNRAFDAPSRGAGTNVPVAAGARVAIIETDGLGAADSSRLADIAGLDRNVRHIVVALGLGNSSSMVAPAGATPPAGMLSEAPFYTNVTKREYGRFLLLFHLATDANDDGDTSDAGETFSEARFAGVLDTRGDWLDEEFSEYTNQKP